MGALTPLAVKIGSISWMPRLLQQIVKCDKALQTISGQRVTLLDVAGLPNVTLVVRGRKSGVPRETRLLAVPVGDDWLIAGSYFGGPVTPQWVHNVRAADTAEVARHGRTYTVHARELDGPERDDAWQLLRDVWPNFDLYERRTARRIPLFRLERVPRAPR